METKDYENLSAYHTVIDEFPLMTEKVCAEQTILLSTLNWEPYTGENLPEHGFFSEIVSEAFSQVGYRVEFQYRPWARALIEAKMGVVHGVMAAYWKEERTEFLEYPDVVWKVKEELFALQNHPITYSGSINDLAGYTIGVLRGSLQAEDLAAAGIEVEAVNDQFQSLRKLLAGRIDAMIAPESLFFYHLKSLRAPLNRIEVKKLETPYKVYDMYVAFSKKNPEYQKLNVDFNRGLDMIKTNGMFEKILEKHDVKHKY